jgi:WD40 repeat protein
MSGQVVASDPGYNIIDKRRDHMKYVVQVSVLEETDFDVVATAGWDNKVNIYKPSSTPPFRFGNLIASIALPTKPEAIILTRHPESAQPILILSRTDSNFLYFYTIECQPRLLGKQNLAPHSNAWVAFTPSALALCPKDDTLIAVGTNSLPHMKLLIVRLLIPPYTTSTDTSTPRSTVRGSLLDDSLVAETQASQARAALAVADREAAAIQIHATTMAPQTAYSTPAIAWRPDASGVWVNGDDGAIRGIEASTGKVVATLNGHEEGSKVRCLWAGMVEKEEWLVSGGFDHRLIVWRNGSDAGDG